MSFLKLHIDDFMKDVLIRSDGGVIRWGEGRKNWGNTGVQTVVNEVWDSRVSVD